MAATDLNAIIDRVQAVLEASPLSLSKSKDAFSHDRQPNTMVTNSYYLRDAGLASSQDQSSNAEARIDQIEIFVGRKVNFDGTTAMETMQTSLIAIERALVADGPSHSYNARAVNRRVTRPGGKEMVVGSLTLSFDYDFSVV